MPLDGIWVAERPAEYEVECSFDLVGLDHPPLGPYSDRAAAVRASEEIAQAVAGTSA